MKHLRAIERLRGFYQRRVPSALRQRLRKAAKEIPIRLRDLPADLRELLDPRIVPLPPARLRGRVGINSSRTHFLEVGSRAADDIVTFLAGLDLNAYPRWLDFGCGAGRVARHLVQREFVRRMTGIDIDRAAIRWSARHLPGEYTRIRSTPPTFLGPGTFDAICAVSVFTHFDEATQNAWLAELRRLLRPGGIFIASTQAPDLTFNRPDLTLHDHQHLQERGFVFRIGIGPFNEDSAFHSAAYLRREWSRYFDLLTFKPAGLVEYLDLSLWRRPADGSEEEEPRR